jgi:hypothetical protein
MITLTKRQAVALLKFASKDMAKRATLCAIHVEHDGNSAVAVATDGHRIAQLRTTTECEAFEAFDVPRSTVEAAVKLMPTKGTIVLTADGIEVGDIVLPFEAPPGSFPNYSLILPTFDRAGGDAFFVNPSYLADLRLIGASLATKCPRIRVIPPEHPLAPVAFVASDDTTEWRAVIMPMRG